jgi:hypothetical protein
MTTLGKPQIRNVMATNPKNGQMWISQPIELGIHDRICGVCKKNGLKSFDAKILSDMR